MKKWLVSLAIGLAILAGCNQETIEDAEAEGLEIINLEDVEIPDTVFESDKEDEVISEDEMKESLTTYLDTFGELSNIQFELMDRMFEESGREEQDLMKQVNRQLKKNDDNFSDYIGDNTLPNGYEVDTLRTYSYVSSSNEFMIEEMEDWTSVFNIPDNVSGREQAKIEAFLEEKGIETTAFTP
ncbi:NDxxF motif lipoprotein [Alkalihalobacillus sp. FSL R5-0424]